VDADPAASGEEWARFLQWRASGSRAPPSRGGADNDPIEATRRPLAKRAKESTVKGQDDVDDIAEAKRQKRAAAKTKETQGLSKLSEKASGFSTMPGKVRAAADGPRKLRNTPARATAHQIQKNDEVTLDGDSTCDLGIEDTHEHIVEKAKAVLQKEKQKIESEREKAAEGNRLARIAMQRKRLQRMEDKKLGEKRPGAAQTTANGNGALSKHPREENSGVLTPDELLSCKPHGLIQTLNH
jgi:hypothetical protein